MRCDFLTWESSYDLVGTNSVDNSNTDTPAKVFPNVAKRDGGGGKNGFEFTRLRQAGTNEMKWPWPPNYLT